PLALRDDAAAMALRTDDGGRPRLGAGAAALTTGRRHLDGNLRLETTQRVLERQPDRNLDVGAALRLRPSPTRLPTVEDPAEQIAEVAEVVDGEVAAAAAAEVDVTGIEARAATTVRRAEPVVLLALLRIGERVVGILDFLELLLGNGVAGILVGVVLRGELAVGLLDLLRRRALLDPERVVQRRQLSPPAEPRRRPAPAAAPCHRACSPSARPRSPSLPPVRKAVTEAPRGRGGRTVPRSRSPQDLPWPAARRVPGARAGLLPRASPPRDPRRPRARARDRRGSGSAP